MLPKVIKNWNLFFDGRGMAGRVEEVKLPKLERQSEAWQAGGMAGPVKFDMGLNDLTLEFTLGEQTAEVISAWGLSGASGLGARLLAAAVAQDGSGTDAIEIAFRGKMHGLDFGTLKTKDVPKLNVSVPLTYFRYSVNNKRLVEIDMVSGLEVYGDRDNSSLLSMIGL